MKEGNAIPYLGLLKFSGVGPDLFLHIVECLVPPFFSDKLYNVQVLTFEHVKYYCLL